MSEHTINKTTSSKTYSIITSKGSDYLPSVAYTKGLVKQYEHPEIIIFGLPVHNMESILKEVVGLIEAGNKIRVSTCYDDFFDNGNAEFIEVHQNNMKDYFLEFLENEDGKSFSALQLVWTDSKNKFPWEAEFEKEFIWKQPLLDRNAGFKFREDADLEVLVACECLDQQKPIVHVIHDHQGKWHFSTGESVEQLRQITLQEVLLFDPTLNEVFDLEYGEGAERENKTGAWFKYCIEIPDEE